jgi:uncharacterized protein YbjT (DUF2867 family)
MRLLTILSLGINSVLALGTKSAPAKILVTGASGRTGQLVFEALNLDPRFDPKALVRSESSAKKLKGMARLDQIVVCDVTELSSDVPSGLEGCSGLVICTSAVPRISKRSLFLALLKAPIRLIQGKKAIDFRSFRFVWKNGQYPEKVDYEGQVAQIDLAKKLKMKRVVVVSSMGGTDKENFLNSVGKDKNGEGNGDILLWKRKAEKYLVDSGLEYVIIHPGGLVDTPAGEEDYVLDIDDILLKNKKRSISRADVANLCVAALGLESPTQISLDCITRPVDSKENVHSADEALADFLKEAKIYNYAL